MGRLLAIRHKVDAGDPSTGVAVALCREPGCGWRHLSGTRAGALRILADHQELMHRRR